MKSIRDVINKMPETRDDLENKVLEYSPEIRKKVEENPEYRETLEKIVNEQYNNYESYIKGSMTHKLSATGHAVGYAADAYFLASGDIVGALGGKFINLLAQLPEKFYKSISYAVRTGSYLGAVQNIIEGIVSYLPGATILDQGLSRIAQKRMLKQTLYKVSEALGVEIKPWHERVYEKIGGKYKDVKNRAGNIVSPRTSGARLKPVFA